jgi:uncharacterized protein (TIGR02996 family)
VLPADLVAAIHAAPDDPDAYLVAADWLQQRGDPHGELIALAIAQASDPGLAPAVDALQEAIDPLAPLERRRWPHDWRWGFLRRAVVSVETRSIVRELLRAPAAQCLRELVVIGGRTSTLVALEVIVDHAPALRALRSLELPRHSIRRAMQPHWPELPELERLVIGAAQLPVESVLPSLRELELDLADHPQDWLDRAPLPTVETLILHSEGPLVDPLRFLAPVPNLRRLTVVGEFGTIDHAGLEALATRVDVVDVISLELMTTSDFRRFATRRPYTPGEAALLAVGGTSPVEPGTLYPLGDGGPFAIGRATTSQLVLGPTSARRHATIEHPRATERWRLTDHLGSTGTDVQGARLASIPLCDGDVVEIGTHVFRFLEHDVAAKAAALARQLALPARNAQLRMSR